MATFPLQLIGKAFLHRWHRWKKVSRLKILTPHEKKVLARYLDNQSTVESWGRGGGPVNVLAGDGILILIASDPDGRNMEPDVYAIDPAVWKRIQRDPDPIKI
jgi:hypothetical protein